jgi:hypothetical protein
MCAALLLSAPLLFTQTETGSSLLPWIPRIPMILMFVLSSVFFAYFEKRSRPIEKTKAKTMYIDYYAKKRAQFPWLEAWVQKNGDPALTRTEEALNADGTAGVGTSIFLALIIAGALYGLLCGIFLQVFKFSTDSIVISTILSFVITIAITLFSWSTKGKYHYALTNQRFVLMSKNNKKPPINFEMGGITEVKLP